MDKEMLKDIDINQIIPPRMDTRSETHEKKIEELMDSIKSLDLIEPIIVNKKGKQFEIIAGHRRFIACKRLGHNKISCITKAMSDDDVVMMRIHENLHREDLSNNEYSDLIAFLHYEKKWDIKVIAKHIKKSEKWIFDRLDLFHMPAHFKESVNDKHMTLSTALELMKITDEAYRDDLFSRARYSGLSAGQAKQWVLEWKRYRGPEIDLEYKDEIADGEREAITPYVKCHLCRQDIVSGQHSILIACTPCHLTVIESGKQIQEDPAGSIQEEKDSKE